MCCRNLSIILILAITLAGLQPILASGEFPPSIGELLKRHNIQLTRPALVDALRNADPGVRYLASQQLADYKATETIPAITEALTLEKLPWTRMNIAFSLAQLGEAPGFGALEDNCRNHDLGAGVRAQSAGYMLSLNHETTVCRDALLDVLQTGSNGYSAQAASLLPRYHNFSVEDSEAVFVALVRALHAWDASVRMAAGQALADLGDARGVAELRLAVGSEQEEDVRLQLEEDLKILTKKIRQ